MINMILVRRKNILHSQVLSHVLDEICGLLTIGELFRVRESGFDGRGVAQLIFREVPPVHGRKRLPGAVRPVVEGRRHLAR